MLLQIIEHEENARQTLLQNKSDELFNHIGRACGILANAHIVSSKEAMNQLSLMRLGVVMGLLPDLDKMLLDELFLVTLPAHLQQLAGEKLSGEERDIHRAALLRERLGDIGGLQLSE